MKKRIVGLLLVMIMVLNPFGFSIANASVQSNTETMNFDFDGKKYELIESSYGDVRVAKITSPELESELEYIIYDDYFVVNYAGESYTISKKDTAAPNVGEKNIEAKWGRARSATNVYAARTYATNVRYGAKTYSKYDDRYYYSWGATGTRDFVKIGCNLNYEICYNYLSDLRKDNVQKYIAYINESNGHYDAAVAAVGAEIVSAIVGMGGAAIALSVLAPEALIVSLIALGFTGVLSSATVAIAEVVASKNDFDKAKDMYEVIKLYGTQI